MTAHEIDNMASWFLKSLSEEINEKVISINTNKATKGAFIIYEREWGVGENLKISIFFRIPPKYLKKIVGPPQIIYSSNKSEP